MPTTRSTVGSRSAFHGDSKCLKPSLRWLKSPTFRSTAFGCCSTRKNCWFPSSFSRGSRRQPSNRFRVFSGQRHFICIGPHSTPIFRSGPFAILRPFRSFQEQPSNPSIESNVRPHEHSNSSFSLGPHRVCALEHWLGRCSLVRIGSGWLSSHPEILDRNHLRRRRWRRLHGLRIPVLGYHLGLGCSSKSECSAFRLLHTGINLSPASGSSSWNLRCFL